MNSPNARRTAPHRTAGHRSDRARAAWLLALPAALFLALFFVWPVATILGRGLVHDGSFDLGAVGSVLRDGRLREVAWFTLWQATVSTALTVVVALPAAWVLGRFRFPGRAAVHAAVTVPFVLPTVVVAAAFVALLGPHGPLGALGIGSGVAAILLAHTFFNVAVVIRSTSSVWSRLDRRREDAARVLGAGRLRVAREITWPALRPALTAAASIVFLFCFTSFGVILILGGVRHSTLETEIYRETAQLLDLRTAAALSVLQMVAVLAALGVGARARGRRAASGLITAADTSHRPRGREWAAVGGILLATGALLGAPITVLVYRSFSATGGLGLVSYRALAHIGATSTLVATPLDAVRNSLLFALAATAIAVPLGAGVAFALSDRRRRPRSARGARAVGMLDALVMLPLGVSAVTVGFGFLITLDRPPLDLRTSFALIPMAHALIALPFVVRTMLPVLDAIDERLRDAASVLGAAPRRVWREVDLPIVARATAVAAGFAFAVSLGEFGATLFIVRPDTPTLPVVIYRLLGRPGAVNTGAALAASTILMVVTAMAVLGIERLRVGRAAEF